MIAVVAFGRETKRAGIDRRHRTNRGAHVEETEALQETALEPVEEMDMITERILESLTGDDAQLPMADLIRLLELRGELADSQMVPLTMGWIGEWPLTPKE
jgi:hypothetical protein